MLGVQQPKPVDLRQLAQQVAEAAERVGVVVEPLGLRVPPRRRLREAGDAGDGGGVADVDRVAITTLVHRRQLVEQRGERVAAGVVVERRGAEDRRERRAVFCVC